MNRNILLAALGVALLTALAFLGLASDRAADAYSHGNSALMTAIGQINNNQSKLAKRLDRLESLYAGSARTPARVIADAQGSGASNSGGPKGSGAVPFASDQEAMAAKHRLEMEDRLISDPLSPKWAMANERAVSDFLSPSNLRKRQLPVPNAFKAQCHSHLCRIGMNFSDADVADETQAMLLLEIAPTLPNAVTFLVPQPDGSVEMVIFAGDPNSIH